ncbi:MAG: LytTR family DNA-binding domain-containing protein [Bacteroidota bacterium]
MPTAVIIDDMPQAIATLREDLAAYCPEVELLGTADGVVSGAKLLRQAPPDVVFLDIELQDGTGFDILELLPDLSSQIIFTTASDAFAIKAFRFSAVDYLLKPIDPDELMAAVAKLGHAPAAPRERLDLLLDTLKGGQTPRRLALHTLEKIHIVDIPNIIRCESSGNYTHFHFADGRQLLVTRTLKEFDQLLQEHRFLRVHQSHLISIDQIKEYVKVDGGYLVMRDGTAVPVSTRKKALVVKLLGEL